MTMLDPASLELELYHLTKTTKVTMLTMKQRKKNVF